MPQMFSPDPKPQADNGILLVPQELPTWSAADLRPVITCGLSSAAPSLCMGARTYFSNPDGGSAPQFDKTQIMSLPQVWSEGATNDLAEVCCGPNAVLNR